MDSLRASSVSIVSPLWLMTNTSVFLSMGALRYLNSLAYSTSTGILAYFSIRYSATRHACHAVPHAQKSMRSIWRIWVGVMLSPLRTAVELSSEILPLMAFSRTVGCSMISFCMKCLQSPSFQSISPTV